MVQYNLEKQLSNEIIDFSIDTTIDYVDIAIGQFIKEEPIKEIPFVKTLYTLGKWGFSIRNEIFIKKTLAFLNDFHKGNIDETKRENFNNRMKNDKRYNKRIMEFLIVYLDRLNNVKKSLFLSRLFIEYINGSYDWNTFTDLSSCIENLLECDYKVMDIISHQKKSLQIDKIYIKEINRFSIYGSIERLRTYGLIDDDAKDGTLAKAPLKRKVFLSDFGDKFYRKCIKTINY